MFDEVVSFKRGLLTKKHRDAVLSAYACVCQYCLGKNGAANSLDHIIPINPRKQDITRYWNILSRYLKCHPDSLENATAACMTCNMQKGNRLLADTQLESLIVSARVKLKEIKRFLAPVGDELLHGLTFEEFEKFPPEKRYKVLFKVLENPEIFSEEIYSFKSYYRSEYGEDFESAYPIITEPN